MAAFAAGYLRLGRLRGVPVFAHWSALLGALFVSRFRWAPGAWVGFALLVLIHEAGHALLVRQVGGRALAIELHGFGGECRWTGEVTPLARAMVAWGGVLAQAVVLVATYAALAYFGPPADAFTADLAMAFTASNLWLIAFNLFPMRPLDGAEAWTIVPLLRQRWATARARQAHDRVHRRAAAEARRLEALDEAEAAGLPAPRAGTAADEATEALFAKLEKDGRVGPRVPEPHDD